MNDHTLATRRQSMPEMNFPDQWAICDLLGHVRLAGRLTEEERFGTKMGRLDIPTNSPCGSVSDTWCPKCGRCSCPHPELAKDDPKCPLHGETSKHAETPEFLTQLFSGSSVYRITIVTEDVAREVCKKTSPVPVSPWDFPKQLTAVQVAEDDGPNCDPDDDEGVEN